MTILKSSNTILSNIILASIAGFMVISMVSKASAATRTICLEFEIRDERFNCPTPGTVGVKRACDPAGNYVNPIGMRYELWDKDDGDGSGDEYIGRWQIAGTGSRCVTFEWENASYSNGETHPDVYARLLYQVTATGTSGDTIVQAADASGNPLGNVWWRNTSQVANNCSGTCDIPGGVMRPTTSSTSDMSQRFQILDSAQRVLQMYVPDLDSGTILARYPGSGCPTGAATARDDFCVPSGQGSSGDLVTH